MKKLIIIIFTIILNATVGLAIAPIITLNGDSTIKENQSIIIDSIKLANIQEFINNSTDYESKLKNLQSKIDKLENSIENPIFLNFTRNEIFMFAFAVLVFVLILVIIIGKIKFRDAIVRIVTTSDRISKWKEISIDEVAAQIQDVQIILEEKINEQKEPIVKQQRTPVSTYTPSWKNNPSQSVQAVESEKVVKPFSKALYADAIIGEVFNKITETPNEYTVYELLLKTPNERVLEFTIYEGAKRRVMKNPDFIDGCEKQRIGNNDLEVEKGITTLQDNGKWQITQKAKVKFV